MMATINRGDMSSQFNWQHVHRRLKIAHTAAPLLPRLSVVDDETKTFERDMHQKYLLGLFTLL